MLKKYSRFVLAALRRHGVFTGHGRLTGHARHGALTDSRPFTKLDVHYSARREPRYSSRRGPRTRAVSRTSAAFKTWRTFLRDLADVHRPYSSQTSSS